MVRSSTKPSRRSEAVPNGGVGAKAGAGGLGEAASEGDGVALDDDVEIDGRAVEEEVADGAADEVDAVRSRLRSLGGGSGSSSSRPRQAGARRAYR